MVFKSFFENWQSFIEQPFIEKSPFFDRNSSIFNFGNKYSLIWFKYFFDWVEFGIWWGVNTKEGPTIKLTLTCNDAKEIIDFSMPSQNKNFKNNELITNPASSFVMEKHLEDYMFKNWKSTVFGINYDIYENGRQFQTDTGPLDILALRNDQKEFLVLELKRDKASDIVVGQILRYMGYVKNKIAKSNQNVRGCIIATEEDQGLKNALSVTPDIDFYKYQVNFSLNKI